MTPRIVITRETHEAPPEIQEHVARAGGLNRLGEPNFRIVWGGSRLSWIGGRWTDRDESGNVIREVIELRRVPKYLPHDRWHIERWMPPETYGTPEQWYSQTVETEDGIRVPALGPFPKRGEYEHCFTLAGPRGEFLQLTPTACAWIVRAIQWSLRQGPIAGRAAHLDQQSRVEKEWDSNADAILDEAVPAFHGQPFVSV